MTRFIPVWLLLATLPGPTPLRSQGLVSGKVYERKHAGFVPVPRARIEAASPEGDTVAAIVADDLGRYLITGLPEGPIVLKVSHPRFHPARSDWHQKGASILCPSSGRCGTVDFEMIPHGELEIRVVDQAGRPVRDAAITVHTIAELGEVERPITKLRGRHISFSAPVPPGWYRIRVEPPRRQQGISYHRLTEDVLLEHSQARKTVELVLHSSRAYRVSGRVLVPGSQHAQRMMVMLRPVQHALPDVPRQLMTFGAPLDRWGRFVVHGVAAGVYDLELSWLDDALSFKDSESYPLKEITVFDDLKGLLLIGPTVMKSIARQRSR